MACQFGSRTLIKRGDRVRLTEALTMDFIARNTAIPVPRPLDIFTFRGVTYILMEFIKGRLLADVWHALSSDQKHDAMRQLKGYMAQLRSLTPSNPTRVQAVNGGPIIDSKMDSAPWGPFDDVEAFNRRFGHEYVRNRLDQYDPTFSQAFAKVEGRRWKVAFTHGDLGPYNILWDDGKIVGIIDWECAGWLPEYWEYYMCYMGSFGSSEWWDMLDEVADRYPDELLVEQCLCQVFTRI